MCGVDGSWFKTKNWEFQFLLRQHQWQNCCHDNSIKGVILFVFFVMDIYGAKFQEHAFTISRDIVYSCSFYQFRLQYYDIITDLICIIEKRTSVSLKRKREISKGKTPFFCGKRPFEYAEIIIFFYIIYTLSLVGSHGELTSN